MGGANDWRRRPVQIGLGIVAFYVFAVWSGHKYQMWRARRRREPKERGDAPKGR